MLFEDLSEELRRQVSQRTTSQAETIFREVIELPGFIIAAASCEGDDLEWTMEGWSVEGVRWSPSSVSIRWTFLARSGDVVFKVPACVRVDTCIQESVFDLYGEVEQTDDQWEHLRADVAGLAYPQAVRLLKPVGPFLTGELLLLDAGKSFYVRPEDANKPDAPHIGMVALSARPSHFEIVHTWPG